MLFIMVMSNIARIQPVEKEIIRIYYYKGAYNGGNGGQYQTTITDNTLTQTDFLTQSTVKTLLIPYIDFCSLLI